MLLPSPSPSGVTLLHTTCPSRQPPPPVWTVTPCLSTSGRAYAGAGRSLIWANLLRIVAELWPFLMVWKRRDLLVQLNLILEVWFNNTFFFCLYPKEFLWKQCSTAQWVALGDENTKIFHAFATRNYRRNFIASLKVDKDIVVSDHMSLRLGSYLPHSKTDWVVLILLLLVVI